MQLQRPRHARRRPLGRRLVRVRVRLRVRVRVRVRIRVRVRVVVRVRKHTAGQSVLLCTPTRVWCATVQCIPTSSCPLL